MRRSKLSSRIALGLVIVSAVIGSCTRDDKKSSEAKKNPQGVPESVDSGAAEGNGSGEMDVNANMSIEGQQPGAPGSAVTDQPAVAVAEPIPQPEFKKAVMRNFRQYSQTLASVTGIGLHEEAIQDTYEKVQYSLPSGNTVETFSPFNQISMVRLAFTFCDELYKRNSELENKTADEIIQHLTNLYPRTLDDDAKQRIDIELRALMNFKETNNANNDKKTGARLACTGFLSSSYFTFF